MSTATQTKAKTGAAKTGAKSGAKSGNKAKTSKTKIKVSKPKKETLAPDHQDVLKAKEKELYEKYGPNGSKVKHKLVRGSTQWDKKRSKYTVEFECAHPGCKAVRRVATSDLFQVTMCEEHTKEARNKFRKEKRKEKGAEKAKAKSGSKN